MPSAPTANVEPVRSYIWNGSATNVIIEPKKRHELAEEQQPELAAAQRGEVEEQAAHDR